MFTFAAYSATRDKALKLFELREQLNVFLKTFSNRVIDTWDASADSVMAPSLNTFKSRVYKFGIIIQFTANAATCPMRPDTDKTNKAQLQNNMCLIWYKDYSELSSAEGAEDLATRFTSFIMSRDHIFSHRFR